MRKYLPSNIVFPPEIFRENISFGVISSLVRKVTFTFTATVDDVVQGLAKRNERIEDAAAK